MNVLALILGARAAVTELLKTKGSIIVTLSNSSFYPDGGGVMYIASKHAALGVVRQLAHEFAPFIRVNGVSPGATKTDIRMAASFGRDEKGEPIRTHVHPSNLDAAVEAVTPLRMHAFPQDHAGAYVLLGARKESRAVYRHGNRVRSRTRDPGAAQGSWRGRSARAAVEARKVIVLLTGHRGRLGSVICEHLDVPQTHPEVSISQSAATFWTPRPSIELREVSKRSCTSPESPEIGRELRIPSCRSTCSVRGTCSWRLRLCASREWCICLSGKALGLLDGTQTICP